MTSPAAALKTHLEQAPALAGRVSIGMADQPAPYVVIWPVDALPLPDTDGWLSPAPEQLERIVVHAVGETIEQADWWRRRVKTQLTPGGRHGFIDGYAAVISRTAGPIRDTDANPHVWSYAIELTLITTQ